MTQPLAPGAFARALKSKRDSERRRRRLISGILGGVAALALLTGYVLWFSPLLATRQVEVSGTSLLTADQVRTAADVELGVPVLRQDTGAIEERVRSLAQVRDVSVARALPATIVINIEERALVYQLVGQGAVQWVDSDGVVFGSSAAATEGIIQVTSKAPDDRLRADIATVVSNLPDTVHGQVSAFDAPAVDRISFELADGRRVVWGSAEESELKAEVLAALLSVDAKVYDVSAPRNPITSN